MNRDSSTQNLYRINLLLSHHKMLNFAHWNQIISIKAILILMKLHFIHCKKTGTELDRTRTNLRFFDID
jgi:hypothetical protein